MSDFVRDSIRQIAILVAFACCLLMAFMLMREAIVGHRFAHDFAVYWRAAGEPAAMAYSPDHPRPFPYMPTMLLWIWPLAYSNFFLGYAVVAVASIAGLIFACRPHLGKGTMALTLVSVPMVRCVRNGQVSAVLAAVLIWACGTRNRLFAGAALGAAFTIKPQLVWLAPLMLLLNRDRQALLAWFASVLSSVALSIALFGSGLWAEWFASMTNFHSVVIDTGVLDIGVTPAAVAEWAGLPAIPFLALGVAAGIALVYVCRNMGPLEKATAIGAGSLLGAPYAMAYDLVVIMPFAAAMVMSGRISAVIPIAGMLHPLPLLVAGYGLLRKGLAPWKRRRGDAVAAVCSVAGNAFGDP
jgi:hypothetical protein